MSGPDVLVVGLGPSGSAAAIALARAGLRVAATAGAHERRGWAGESIAPGTASLLAAAIGPDLLGQPPHAIAHGVRSAWGSPDLVDADYLASPLGDGWHLDRAAFDAGTRQAALDAGVEPWDAGPVTAITREGDGWRVRAGDAERTASWIVDASGRHGAIVGRLGVPRHRFDRQVAEVAVVADVPSARVTTVESAPDGWWYSTPLPQAGRVVVRLTDADLRPAGPGDPADLARRLQDTRHIAPLVGSTPDRVRVVEAGVACRGRLAGRGWAATGDAAVAWDPMSGQGVVTAVLMGARLGEALADLIAGGDRDRMEAWERDYGRLLAEHRQSRWEACLAEDRWPASEFWRRRRQPVDSAPVPVD